MTRILSGHFSVHDYGTYSQIMLLATTVSTLTILGMSDGINYFFCKENDEKKREKYSSTIFFMQGALNIIVAVVLVACAVPISKYFGNEDVKKLIVFAAILPTAQNAISILQIMFIAIGKAKHIAVRNFIVSVFKLIAIIVACYIFDNITVVLICHTILEVAQIVYFVISLHNNNCRLNIHRFDISLIGEISKYCIPMALFTIVKTLNRDCDKYIISAFTDTETLAMYSNASKHLPFDIIMISFCTVLLPYITRYIANRKYDALHSVYKSFIELSYITTSILIAGAVCVSPELITFLYTDKYIAGLSVFVVYLFVEMFSFLNLTMVLSAAGKAKIILFVSLGAFGSNIAINLLFYNFLGLIGPAVATLLVSAIQGIVMIAFSSKAIKASIFKLFDFSFVALFVFELLGMGAVVYGLRRLISPLDMHYFIKLCLCFGVYVLPLLLVNFKRIKRCIATINTCKRDH